MGLTPSPAVHVIDRGGRHTNGNGVWQYNIMNISRIKHTLLNYCTSIIDTQYVLVSTLYFPFPTNGLMEKQTRSKQTDSI